MDQKVLKLFVKNTKTGRISEDDISIFDDFINDDVNFQIYDQEKKQEKTVTVYKSNNKTGNKLF